MQITSSRSSILSRGASRAASPGRRLVSAQPGPEFFVKSSRVTKSGRPGRHVFLPIDYKITTISQDIEDARAPQACARECIFQVNMRNRREASRRGVDWVLREKRFQQERVLRKIERMTAEFNAQEKFLVSKLRELGRLRLLLGQDGGVEQYLTPEIDTMLRKISDEIQRNKVSFLDGLGDDYVDAPPSGLGGNDRYDGVDAVDDIDSAGEAGGAWGRDGTSRGFAGGSSAAAEALLQMSPEDDELAKAEMLEKAEEAKFQAARAKLPKYFYKECAVVGNHYYAISDGKTEFVGDRELFLEKPSKALLEDPKRDTRTLMSHIVFPSVRRARLQIFPGNARLKNTPRVVVKCKVDGRFIKLSGNSEAYWFESIVPVALKRWFTTPTP